MEDIYTLRWVGIEGEYFIYGRMSSLKEKSVELLEDSNIWYVELGMVKSVIKNNLPDTNTYNKGE